MSYKIYTLDGRLIKSGLSQETREVIHPDVSSLDGQMILIHTLHQKQSAHHKITLL